ncbi:MAG TPA: hypothetical protein VN132_11955 [Bdellovibrio sp.]|nr:hypothetical protein [Bdellovibrio sp.]
MSRIVIRSLVDKEARLDMSIQEMECIFDMPIEMLVHLLMMGAGTTFKKPFVIETHTHLGTEIIIVKDEDESGNEES